MVVHTAIATRGDQPEGSRSGKRELFVHLPGVGPLGSSERERETERETQLERMRDTEREMRSAGCVARGVSAHRFPASDVPSASSRETPSPAIHPCAPRRQAIPLGARGSRCAAPRLGPPSPGHAHALPLWGFPSSGDPVSISPSERSAQVGGPTSALALCVHLSIISYLRRFSRAFLRLPRRAALSTSSSSGGRARGSNATRHGRVRTMCPPRVPPR